MLETAEKQSVSVADTPTARSLAGKVAAGLHLPIRRTRRTTVNDIAVVAEHACELLSDVCAAVSTAGAR